MVRVTHLLLLSLAAQSSAAAQAVPDTAEIRTAGTARQSVPADLATITLKFTAQDSTPSRAESRLALRADSVRRALSALGIPRDSMLTGSRWYWWNGRVEVLPHSQCVRSDPLRGCTTVYDTTYRATEIIDVHIRDLTKVGAVIDAALALRVTDISNPQFSATDVTAAGDRALREATVRARQQAETIAAASGGRLGRVLSLSTQSDYSERYFGIDGVSLSVRGGGDNPAGTQITPPTVTVSVTVYGRWQLLDH